VFPELPQFRVHGQQIAYQFLGGEREQHLPAVGGGEQSRDPVEGRTEVVTTLLFGRPGACGGCTYLDTMPTRNLVAEVLADADLDPV
jgi:hypothetical protein